MMIQEQVKHKFRVLQGIVAKSGAESLCSSHSGESKDTMVVEVNPEFGHNSRQGGVGEKEKSQLNK